MMIGFRLEPWPRCAAATARPISDSRNHQQHVGDRCARRDARCRRSSRTSRAATRRADLDPPNSGPSEAEHFLADLERILAGGRRPRPPRRRAGSDASTSSRGRVILRSQGGYSANQPGYFTTIADKEGSRPATSFSQASTRAFYEWQGYMEGAARSGLRAARKVYRLLRG